MLCITKLLLLSIIAGVAHVSGQTYAVSFTKYGSPENNPNCNAASHNSCGFYTYPGYSAAASSNLYTANGGRTGACSTCYSATINRDANGNFIPQKSILIMINNVCPVSSRYCEAGPVSGAPNARCWPCEGGKAGCCNEAGMQANIDLCDDSGAAGALFPPGSGFGKGWVTVTDCANWYAKGYKVKYDG